MKKKITFSLPAEAMTTATEAMLLGDFNNWDVSNPVKLKKQKDGSHSATLLLEAGKSYEYRFLLNNGEWVNDWYAEKYIFKPEHGVDNSLIYVPETEEADKKTKAAKPRVQAVPKAKTKKEIPAGDDFTLIEGIGTEISKLFAAANIHSFKDLAKTTGKKLKSIIAAAEEEFDIPDPATWPKQAKLAAAAQWEKLKELQEQLKKKK